MGVRASPAEARAMAPVARFAVLERWGSVEEEYCRALGGLLAFWGVMRAVDGRRGEKARCCRSALRDEK